MGVAVEAKEYKIKKAWAASAKILQAISQEITPETVKRLLFTRKGTLYSQFPSKKVRKWAERLAEKWNMECYMGNLFYEVMRSIYKELEFDLGRNVNLGGMICAGWDIIFIVSALIEKEVGDDIDLEVVKNKTVDEIRNYRTAIVEHFTKGVSLGALRWFTAMGLDRGGRLIVKKVGDDDDDDEFDELILDSWLNK